MLDVFVLVRETPVNTPCTDSVHSCPKKDARSPIKRRNTRCLPPSQIPSCNTTLNLKVIEFITSSSR